MPSYSWTTPGELVSSPLVTGLPALESDLVVVTGNLAVVERELGQIVEGGRLPREHAGADDDEHGQEDRERHRGQRRERIAFEELSEHLGEHGYRPLNARRSPGLRGRRASRAPCRGAGDR